MKSNKKQSNSNITNSTNKCDKKNSKVTNSANKCNKKGSSITNKLENKKSNNVNGFANETHSFQLDDDDEHSFEIR